MKAVQHLTCTNCGSEPAVACILCPACLDLYLDGQLVQGAFGTIENHDGRPAPVQLELGD